jgi:hypothetical protein
MNKRKLKLFGFLNEPHVTEKGIFVSEKRKCENQCPAVHTRKF